MKTKTSGKIEIGISIPIIAYGITTLITGVIWGIIFIGIGTLGIKWGNQRIKSDK